VVVVAAADDDVVAAVVVAAVMDPADGRRGVDAAVAPVDDPVLVPRRVDGADAVIAVAVDATSVVAVAVVAVVAGSDDDDDAIHRAPSLADGPCPQRGRARAGWVRRAGWLRFLPLDHAAGGCDMRYCQCRRRSRMAAAVRMRWLWMMSRCGRAH